MRDRTREFGQLCDAVVRARGTAAPMVAPLASVQRHAREQHALNSMAARIGHALHETAQRLQELMRLAQAQTPFGDPTARIEELTFHVKADMARIQGELQTLEGQAAARGGEHGSALVHTLQGRLLHATRTFASALQTRTENLRVQQQRRERLGTAQRSGPVPRFVPDMDDDEDEIAIAVPLLQAPDTLLLERSEQVRDIEQHMSDVQSIFRRLADLVAHQGEQITRIEDSLGEAEVHAGEAHRQLLTYLHSVASERWLIAKVFGVLLVFIFLFVLFFV